MYHSPSSTSASTGPGSQSIFHSNPELVRRVSVAVGPQLSQSSYTPQDRSLPPIPTLDESTPIGGIEDAFVQFILYCNPTLPLNLDATELRQAFRNVPKSDGKAFEVNRLLALLRQFETGEIRTWTRLVTELGVERTPQQSTQKIQQYAVRLKRWMRAMHIDTFFEFCMGHSHAYFTQIPDPSKPTAAVRDGVPTEEDVALRALLPELRQRRPRPSASTSDQEPQPSLGQETGPSRSALAADTEARQEQDPESSNIQRSTLYLSESSSSAGASATSSSSVVPSGKRRKRHGPAVSSAWITQDPSGRGRPAAVAPQQQQQEAEEAEFQLRRSLDKKFADSGVMRKISLLKSFEDFVPTSTAQVSTKVPHLHGYLAE
ncbi:ARS binding protein 2-domain-containing protein [Lipomyces mesembrius]